MKKFALLLVAICLVVGLSGTAWALHPDLYVNLEVTWFTDEFDFSPKVTLLDFDGDPVDIEWMSYLDPDTYFTDFSFHFINIPDDCVRYRIEWLDVNHEYINDASPIEGWINWGSEEIVEQTHVWDW